MSAAIEIPPVTYPRVEQAYKHAMDMRFSNRMAYAELGLRLARARHPKLLKALDAAAEVMTAENEKQLGRTQRDSGTAFAERSVPTEVSLWREAYRLADAGRPIEHFQWIYGAAAELAGMW